MKTYEQHIKTKIKIGDWILSKDNIIGQVVDIKNVYDQATFSTTIIYHIRYDELLHPTDSEDDIYAMYDDFIVNFGTKENMIIAKQASKYNI